MPDENKPPTPSIGVTVGDVASILSGHVSKADHQRVLDQLKALTDERDEAKKELAKLTGESGTASKRLKDLESKLRDRSYRDAYGKIADELKVRGEFRGDVYDLLKIEPDSDEPDEKALRKRLVEFLDQRKHYLDAGDGQSEGSDGGDSRERRRESKQPLERGEGSTRGSQAVPPGKFKVSKRDIRNPDWMKQNQSAYAKAAREGNLVLVD